MCGRRSTQVHFEMNEVGTKKRSTDGGRKDAGTLATGLGSGVARCGHGGATRIASDRSELCEFRGRKSNDARRQSVVHCTSGSAAMNG